MTVWNSWVELRLEVLKSTFYGEKFRCRLPWSISSDITAIHSWNVCQSQKLQKNTKTPNFETSMSSVLVPLERSSAVLVMISSKSVSICNHSHARRTISGKIMILSGTPLWCPHSKKNLTNQRHEIWSQKTRFYTQWKSRVSISTEFRLVPGHDRQTDGRTDRITSIINLRSVVHELSWS